MDAGGLTAPGTPPATATAAKAAAARRAADPRRRRVIAAWRLSLGVVVAIALAIRLGHVSQLYYTTPSDTIPTYGELYMKWLSTGTLNAGGHDLLARNPPGYFLVVGLIRQFFGMENFRLVLFLQAIADAGTVALMGVAGRVLYGMRAGLMAALAWALYRIATAYTGQIGNEPLTVFLTMGSIVACLKLLDRPTWRGAVGTGAMLALAAHFRLNVLTLLGAFGCYALVGAWRRWRGGQASWFKAFGVPAAVVAVVIALIIPVSVKNSRVLGAPVVVCGADAERILEGANPNSHGEGNRPFPAAWVKRIGYDRLTQYPKDRADRQRAAKAQREIAGEFFYKTHPEYYLFTIVPWKAMALLTGEHVFFAGRGDGAFTELPLGPRVRVPWLESSFLVMLGLLGLPLAGRRYRGFAALAWGILFLTVQGLTAEARYRLLSELPLTLSAGALVSRVYFGRLGRAAAARRFGLALAALALVAAGLTALSWARFSGPNLLAAPANTARNPVMAAMATGSGYTLERPLVPGQPEPGKTRIEIGSFPVDGGHFPHVAFAFDFALTRLKEREADYRAGGLIWPELRTFMAQYDDTGTTVAEGPLQSCDLNDFHTAWGHQWRVLELRGVTRSMRLWFETERAGTVRVRNLEARGPAWRAVPE